MSRQNKQYDRTVFDWATTFSIYKDYLTELASSRFKWIDLPDTIDERFLEMTLMSKGQAVFFEDEELGYLALSCATKGNFSVYRVPMDRSAIASNGYYRELTADDSVLIYNNYLRTPTIRDVIFYAKKLANLDMTIAVNVNAQKTPVFIQCDETQRLTMLNLYAKYDGNEPFIFGDRNLNTNSIKVLKTDAPFIAGDLMELKNQIWNECLTHLGITNINMTKKERLVRDEVIRNQGGIISSRHSPLESRRTACEKINAMFGLDIWCEYREDYREMDDEVMLTGETEDEGLSVSINDINTNSHYVNELRRGGMA